MNIGSQLHGTATAGGDGGRDIMKKTRETYFNRCNAR